MVEEKKRSFSAYFVTLTYDDKNLPPGDCYRVNKDHSDFISALKRAEKADRLNERYEISKEELERKRNQIREYGPDGKRLPIKYYGCLEYGPTGTRRPHLHYILFNIMDTANIYDSWGRGFVDVDVANVNNIDYVCKYIIKPDDEKKLKGRIPEKSWMSKGLGKDVLSEEELRYIKEPENNRILNSRSTPIPLPRYYQKQHLTEEERKRKGIFIQKQVKEDQEKKEKLYKKYGMNIDKADLQKKEVRLLQFKSSKKRDLNNERWNR